MDGPMMTTRRRRQRHALITAALTVALAGLAAGAMHENGKGPWTTALVVFIILMVGGWLAVGAHDGAFEE